MDTFLQFVLMREVFLSFYRKTMAKKHNGKNPQKR